MSILIKERIFLTFSTASVTDLPRARHTPKRLSPSISGLPKILTWLDGATARALSKSLKIKLVP